MAEHYSSADNKISVPGGGEKKPQVNVKAMIAGMPKDVRKRWMVVLAIGTVAMSGIAGLMSSGGSSTPMRAKPADTAAIDTTPKGLSSQKDWKAQTGAELQSLKQALSESNAAQKELLARMEAMRQDMSQIKANGGASGPAIPASRPDFSLPPPPEPPKLTPPSAAVPQQAPVHVTAPAPVDAAPAKRSAARSFIPAGSEVDAKVEDKARVQEEMVPNDRMGYLPAASFASSTLISGVEAFTGGTAQTTPQPVVLRIDENAILPNAVRYQLKGCHVLASVWGDMSSERVFGRLATLTCVDSNNKLVLSEEVEGTLVDSDGKNGIRGSLQDRQGAKLARSLLAGFAQGMSSAFGAAQATVSTGVLGTTTTLAGADAVAAASYKGAGSAAQSLAQYYLKQAEATMPVIAVDAGRKISVLFTKSKALRFETTGAYRVKPKTSLKVERSAE